MVHKIFIVGGTGAQGMPIVKSLVSDKKYHCRILTRDTSSHRAQELLALGNVELVSGTFANESDLRNGYRGCDGAFVNIDGFNTGEKTETYWAIRAYELALEEGIEFFVYGNLDYGYQLGGYDPKFRCGHYDGKGRIGEWVLFQNAKNQGRMRAALFTTGPYIDMAIGQRTPMTPYVDQDGVVTWAVPLGHGAVPHVCLQDCGVYVRWLLENPEEANGMNLEVAIEHVAYEELAHAFEKVSGHPARFVDVDLDTYWGSKRGVAPGGDRITGYNADAKDPAAMTNRQNFTGFWNLWKHSGDNRGVVRRDYALLDRIHPNRVRSVEEWFRLEEQRGVEAGKGSLWERVQEENLGPVLKIAEDGFKGRL
ncbi:NAD(P)-binding protein [Aspergillus germanicus]